MTVKYSYKFLNVVQGGKGTRSALEDFILTVKDGTIPTNCEDARTGTTLAVYTNNGNSVASTDRSAPKVYKLVPATGYAANNTVAANVTIEGTTTTHTYTIPASANTDQKVASNVARMIDDIPQLAAICEGNAVNIWVRGRIAGQNYVIADGGGSYTLTVTLGQNQVRVDALQLGNAANGVLSKNAADTWKCNAANANGTAGYWTMHTPDDALGADANYAYKRVQGTIATVGGDLTIDPATITANSTSTINNFTITLPVSKTT